jgi:DNA-directed RNA polymerase specialized sigma subunit
MTKRRLLQYSHVKLEIAELEQRSQELRHKAGMTTQSYDKPRVCSDYCDPYPEIIDKLLHIDALITAKLCELYAEEAKIEQAISMLDSRGRRIMRLRYIEGVKLEQAAESMGYTYGHMRELHRKYLDIIKNHEVIL